MHQSRWMRRWRCGLLLVMLRLGNGDDTAGSSCVFNVAGVEYDLEPLIRDNECAARAKYARKHARAGPLVYASARIHTTVTCGNVHACTLTHARTHAHCTRPQPHARQRTFARARACTRTHARLVRTGRTFCRPRRATTPSSSTCARHHRKQKKQYSSRRARNKPTSAVVLSGRPLRSVRVFRSGGVSIWLFARQNVNAAYLTGACAKAPAPGYIIRRQLHSSREGIAVGHITFA